MVAIRTNLFATPSLHVHAELCADAGVDADTGADADAGQHAWVRADAGKDGRGMMGID